MKKEIDYSLYSTVLTKRQLEVKKLLDENFSCEQIAQRLNLKLATVKMHVDTISRRIASRNNLHIKDSGKEPFQKVVQPKSLKILFHNLRNENDARKMVCPFVTITDLMGAFKGPIQRASFYLDFKGVFSEKPNEGYTDETWMEIYKHLEEFFKAQNCTGSKCHCWRWVDPTWIADLPAELVPALGYCGRVGQPGF